METNKTTRKIVGITSPPFKNTISSEKHGIDISKTEIWSDKSQLKIPIKYGNSNGQIGLLKSKNTQEDFNINQFHSCDESLVWTGCYGSDKYFKKFLTPESYSHPAKMSMLLADRIFKHLKKLGLLDKNSLICDFMAGTSRTGILASLHGFDYIGVELEKHFVDMSNANFEKLKKVGQFCQCEE